VIVKHNNCTGLTLFRWGRFQIELWICPKGDIPPHLHSKIDSTIYLLFGSMLGRIGDKVGFPSKLKGYKIPAGVVHSATCLSLCVFANIERWNAEATSAAEDFITP